MARESTRTGWGVGADRSDQARLRRQYPTVADLERKAQRRIPRFAYDFLVSGTDEDMGLARNREAFDRIEIVPRYGRATTDASTRVDLFGQTYAAPIIIAPTGLGGLIWPNLEQSMAHAARASGIGYMLPIVSSVALEDAAQAADGSLWLQLYNFRADGHAVLRDLLRRAEEAKISVLAATIDVPARSKRLRDLRNGLQIPFRLTPKTILDVAKAPRWAWETLKTGTPTFRNLAPYVAHSATPSAIAEFVAGNMIGAFTWEEIDKLRSMWGGKLLIKGVLHPDDATEAVARGVDGIIVSNHGGRQFDAAPAPIDVLPAISEAVGQRATILVDGGIRCGLDVLRALACGADAVMVGRPFAAAAAALGPSGPAYFAATLIEETRTALIQSGALTSLGARDLVLRHSEKVAFHFVASR